MKATEITTSHVKRFIDKRMQEGAANATINRELAALKRMFNLGAECTPPKVSQVPHIPMLREDNVRKGFFEPGSFDLLMEYLPEHLRPVVFFGYCTGWRKEEILSLTWDKVDLKNHVIRLEAQDTKDREPRVIPIGEPLYNMLKNMPRAIHSKNVFLFNGKPVRDIRTSLYRACKAVGIETGRNKKDGFVFHDLRHTFNTYMRKAGVQESVIMGITGHSTREMFDRYNTIDSIDKRQAVDQMQAFLASVDQNVDQAPKNEQGANSTSKLTPCFSYGAEAGI